MGDQFYLVTGTGDNQAKIKKYLMPEDTDSFDFVKSEQSFLVPNAFRRKCTWIGGNDKVFMNWYDKEIFLPFSYKNFLYAVDDLGEINRLSNQKIWFIRRLDLNHLSKNTRTVSEILRLKRDWNLF